MFEMRWTGRNSLESGGSEGEGDVGDGDGELEGIDYVEASEGDGSDELSDAELAQLRQLQEMIENTYLG